MRNLRILTRNTFIFIKHDLKVFLVFLFYFLVNTVGVIPSAYAAPLSLPQPGVKVSISPPFNPAIFKGIKIYPHDPLRMDMLIDAGDDNYKQADALRMMRYFLAALTLPEEEMWVNLSPYEKMKIVPKSFGLTEMGRDLLAQDYLLKQMMATLMSPDEPFGKQFWQRIYAEAKRKYGNTDVNINTFNKVWIVPDYAKVLENSNGDEAYITASHLTVKLDLDYLSQEKNDTAVLGQVKSSNDISTKMMRELLLPQLIQEVNENKNFAVLRQVYGAVVLAAWYKSKLNRSVINTTYANKHKISGIRIKNKKISQEIYGRYLKAYQKGVYRGVDIQGNQGRSYVVGGVNMAMTTMGANKLIEIKVGSYRPDLKQGIVTAFRLNPIAARSQAMLTKKPKSSKSAGFTSVPFKEDPVYKASVIALLSLVGIVLMLRLNQPNLKDEMPQEKIDPEKAEQTGNESFRTAQKSLTSLSRVENKRFTYQKFSEEDLKRWDALDDLTKEDIKRKITAAFLREVFRLFRERNWVGNQSGIEVLALLQQDQQFDPMFVGIVGDGINIGERTPFSLIHFVDFLIRANSETFEYQQEALSIVEKSMNYDADHLTMEDFLRFNSVATALMGKYSNETGESMEETLNNLVARFGELLPDFTKDNKFNLLQRDYFFGFMKNPEEFSNNLTRVEQYLGKDVMVRLQDNYSLFNDLAILLKNQQVAEMNQGSPDFIEAVDELKKGIKKGYDDLIFEPSRMTAILELRALMPNEFPGLLNYINTEFPDTNTADILTRIIDLRKKGFNEEKIWFQILVDYAIDKLPNSIPQNQAMAISQPGGIDLALKNTVQFSKIAGRQAFPIDQAVMNRLEQSLGFSVRILKWSNAKSFSEE